MPTETLLTQMLQRRGTASEWATANPVLKDGEIAIIEGTKTFKVGDGVTAFSALTTWYAEVSQAYVVAQVAALVNSAPSTLDTLAELAAALTADESAAATLATLVGTKAPLADPALTGNPTAPTQSAGNNSTRIATTAFVVAAIAAAISAISSNSQAGTTYTTVLGDAGQVVEAAAAGASTFTIPPNSSVAYPVGSVINFYAAGLGGLTIAAGAGVTIRNNTTALTQYQEVSVRKRATDEWVRIG